MNKRTKLFTLLLAAVLCAGAMGSCGSESTTSSVASPDGNSTAASGETCGDTAPDTSEEVNLIYYL